MTRAFTRSLWAVSFAAIMLLDPGFHTSVAQAGDCSPHGLSGSWGTLCEGTFVNPPLGLTAAVSLFRFTKSGELFVTETQRLPDGTISHHTATGTYLLNPDCTGTMETFNDIDNTRIQCALALGRKKKELYAIVEAVELANGTLLDVNITCTLQRQ